jgi:hypothetical protein
VDLQDSSNQVQVTQLQRDSTSVETLLSGGQKSQCVCPPMCTTDLGRLGSSRSHVAPFKRTWAVSAGSSEVSHVPWPWHGIPGLYIHSSPRTRMDCAIHRVTVKRADTTQWNFGCRAPAAPLHSCFWVKKVAKRIYVVLCSYCMHYKTVPTSDVLAYVLWSDGLPSPKQP